MILRISGHKFHYEMENLCRVFFPYEKIKTVYDESGERDEGSVETILVENLTSVVLTVKVRLGSRTKTSVRSIPLNRSDLISECEREMAIALFEAISELTGYIPEWGILTGVRPSKLMANLIRLYGEEGAKTYFTNRLLVSTEKTNLAAEVVKNEKEIIDGAPADTFSLYISIPFCPSRCSYCSFVSHSISGKNAIKLLPAYVDNLCRELEITGKIAFDLGINLQTVYWGGGTPTSLDEEDLACIFEAVKENFSLSGVEEYTVEAGRPDTVTADKLSVLKN